MSDAADSYPVPAAARAAAALLCDRAGVDAFDVAAVLGSGWQGAAGSLGRVLFECATSELDGFVPATVRGHSGRALALDCDGVRVLVFSGRTHLYEGLGVGKVVLPVQVASAASCRCVVLTNGCGSLDRSVGPGSVVALSDHVNLFGVSPLPGPFFVDMSDAYSSRLRSMVRELDPSVREGVYVQFLGPQYETPAEVGLARAIGGSLVGMSMVQETIEARFRGMEVLGLSLVTNLASGLSGGQLDHAEVLEAGAAAAGRLGELLGRIIARL